MVIADSKSLNLAKEVAGGAIILGILAFTYWLGFLNGERYQQQTFALVMQFGRKSAEPEVPACPHPDQEQEWAEPTALAIRL